jgi:hypothetical protein
MTKKDSVFEPVNSYIVVPRGRVGELMDPVQWANTLSQALTRKAELEAELGGDWVVAARLF